MLDLHREGVLNEVLYAIRLRSVVYRRGCFTASWGYHTKTYRAPHFHFLTSGRCWLKVERMTAPVSVSHGDLVIIGPGLTYSLRDDLDSSVEDLDSALERRSVEEKQSGIFAGGNGGSSTTMVCGDFQLEESGTNPLLASLPPTLILRNGSDASSSLQAAVFMMEAERTAGRPGAEPVIARLMDVIFLQAIRSNLADQQLRPGWIGALLDPAIGQAIVAFHNRLQASWTVDVLAQEAGMSRSAFCDRFTELLQQSPMRYVTSWRMNRAAYLLRSSEDKIAAVAARVGYESEGAFCRAFKRGLGLSPGAYRLCYLAANKFQN